MTLIISTILKPTSITLILPHQYLFHYSRPHHSTTFTPLIPPFYLTSNVNMQFTTLLTTLAVLAFASTGLAGCGDVTAMSACDCASGRCVRLAKYETNAFICKC